MEWSGNFSGMHFQKCGFRRTLNSEHRRPGSLGCCHMAHNWQAGKRAAYTKYQSYNNSNSNKPLRFFMIKMTFSFSAEQEEQRYQALPQFFSGLTRKRRTVYISGRREPDLFALSMPSVFQVHFFAVTKHSDQKQRREGKVMSSPRPQPILDGSRGPQGRNESRNLEELCLPVHVSSFYVQPRATCLRNGGTHSGLAPPTTANHGIPCRHAQRAA